MAQFVAVITETNFASVADGNREDAGKILGTYGPFNSEAEASAFTEKAVAVFEAANEKLSNYSDDIEVNYDVKEMSLNLPTLSSITGNSEDDIDVPEQEVAELPFELKAEPALGAFMRDKNTVVVPFGLLKKRGKYFILTDADTIAAIAASGQERFESVHPTDDSLRVHYYL